LFQEYSSYAQIPTHGFGRDGDGSRYSDFVRRVRGGVGSARFARRRAGLAWRLIASLRPRNGAPPRRPVAVLPHPLIEQPAGELQFAPVDFVAFAAAVDLLSAHPAWLRFARTTYRTPGVRVLRQRRFS